MASDATPPAHTPPHEGSRGVRDQVERYRSSFIAVVTMILIAAAVGGYILAHQNLHLPGWVPVLGKNYYTLKARFQTAQAVTPGQGQAVTVAGAKVGEVDDRGTERRGRHGDHERHPQVRPLLQERDHADAPQDGSAGHDDRDQPGHAGCREAPQRRNAARLPDRPERRLRRIPRRPGRGNALLPAGPAGGRRGRPLPQREGAVGDAQALPADHPAGDRNHPRTAATPPEHRPLDPQLPAAGGSDRGQGRTARRAGQRLQRGVRDLRQAGRQLPQDAAPAPGGAGKDGQRTRQGQDRLARAGEDADGARAVREGARPGPGSHAQALAGDDADHQERHPPVRPRNPAGGQRTGSLDRRLRQGVPQIHRHLRGAERILQRARLQPGTEEGRLPVLPRLGQPRPQQRASAPPTRTGRWDAASCTSTAKCCRC